MMDAAERAAIVPSELSPDELWRRNGKYVPIELVRAARQDEREQCRIVALIHSQYPITTDYDRGYDQARKDAAESIKRRALAEEVTRGNVKWVTRDELAEMYPDPDERKR